MPNITIVDTSCLILFSKIDQTELLKKLFGQICITKTVASEFKKPLPDWIKVIMLDPVEAEELSSSLDLEEATSIKLASNHNGSLLVIDERKGRRTAKKMGIKVTGSLGIFVAAKEKGIIEAVKPILNKIQQTNFRISDGLIQKVLEKAEEI